MKINELKRLAIHHSMVDYSDDNDSDFIVIALSKFAKLVAVAEAAKKLVKETPCEPIGYVHIPPAFFFFDLQTKLEFLEQN